MNISASITALALAGGCFLSNPASAVQIQSRDLSGYCIDVSNANFQLGQAILLYACHGSNNQIWSIRIGTIYASRVNSFEGCLGWDGADDPPDGTPVTLQWCNTNPPRRWTVTANGQMSTASGKCLDTSLNSASANKGAPITLRRCADASNGSIWIFN